MKLSSTLFGWITILSYCNKMAQDNERRRRICNSIILVLFFVIQATTITKTSCKSLIEKRQLKNDFEANFNSNKHTQSTNNTKLSNSTTLADNNGAAKQQHQFGAQLLPIAANQNKQQANNRTDKLESLDKLLASGSKAKAKAIRVDSKTGKTLARMQPSKRQVDGNGELNGGNSLSGTPSSSSSSRRNEDPWFLDQTPYPLQPYRFVYNIKGKNGLTEQYRQEVGDGKYLTGSYGYVLPDGIYRHVDYVADDRGFRAFIRTSEPGTANQNPSNVVINSNPVVTAPGVTYVSNTNNESLFPLTNYGVPLSPPPNQPLASLTDYSSSQSSAGQTLARRPPGSIVNTPLRNFTSFSYTTPAPFLSSATPSLFNFRASSFNDGYPILNNTSTSSSSSPTSSLSLQTLNKPSTSSQSGTSWGSTSGNQFVDEDVFTRIKPLPIPATNTQPIITNNYLNYNKLDYSSAAGQDKPQSTVGNLFSQRQAIELQSKNGPGKLAYDRLLSNQDSSGATNKLNYDMNYVFHPESPLLSLERARNLAQLDQLNAAGPGLQYIRPLLSTDAGNLSPLSQINSGSQFGGGNAGGINLSSSRSGVEHSSKSEEHHQRRTESQSRQNSDTNNNLLVTSKEHQAGAKSGSGREFEYHQTTNHNLLPLSGPGQLLPPPPYLDSRANTDGSGQLQAPPTVAAAAVKGGGGGGGQNRQLQAPYAGFAQQPRSEQGVKTIQEQFNGQASLPPPTAPLPPSPPAQPSPPEEPSSGRPGGNQEFQQQQQNNGPVTLSPGSGEQQQQQQQAEQQAATKSTLGPFDQQTTSAQSSTTSSSGSHDYDQDSSDQQARKSTKSGETKQRSQQSESWLGATRPPSSIPSPIRTVRMQPDDFRTTVMMNDLRSMQNTFGLPQPPRLHRERSPHEVDQFQVANLNPTPHLDQILASRMNRVNALLSSARSSGSNKFNDPQNEPQNRLQSQNLVSGSSSNQAASIHKSNALRASGSKANEIVDEHLARLHSNNNNNNNKPPKQRKAASNATSTHNNNNNLDESISFAGKQRFQTGPIIKLSNSLDGGNNFNEAKLLSVNETLFDARRLSAANKAKLQAEKVSELEKFQQRLRTQQLLLEQIKNPTIEKPGFTFATAANKTAHQLATARRNNNNSNQQPLTSNEQVNSHVKYDEEVDGSIAASRAGFETRGSNQNGSNQSHSLSSSSLENLKPLLFKIEPTSRDYTRLRRQNAGNESTLSPISSSSLNEQQRAGNSEDKFFNISLNSTTLTKRLDSEPSSSSGGEKNSGSEFAQQIKRWPSILHQNSIDTNTTTSANTNNDLNRENLLDRLIDSKPTDVASLNRETDSKSNAHQNKSASAPATSSNQQQAATNTINLDFINSVTALSVDHLNPFAISSVNPAVQRSFAASQQQMDMKHGSGSNGFHNHNSHNGSSDGFESRLSPHKLGETGPNIGVATTSARYFNSPEILAALDYHEKRDTSGHLKSLLPDESVASHKPTMIGESHGLRPTNHRFAALAPYTMKQQIDLNQLGTKKILLSGAGSHQEQTLSSSEKKSSYDSTIPKLHEISNHKLSQYSPIKETQSSSSSPLLNKDGFEIEKNSAHVQVDNQRFYEVVSSFSPPNDYSSSIASSQAFRG